MIRLGTAVFPTTLLALLSMLSCLAAETQVQPPAFQEVYDLLSKHLSGVSAAELNRKSVEALVSALSPEVALVTNDALLAQSGPGAVTKQSLFDPGVGYVRVGRVEDNLPKAVQLACQKLAGGTNKLIGIILDLRYAQGENYSAAASTAGIFLKKEQPLLDWGKGVVRSTANPDALDLPLTVLINHQTSGAAEALAAILRETNRALLLGSRSAGQAMLTQDYPLSNGQQLRIATAPVRLADGTPIGTGGGVRPDITIEVKPEQALAYFADAYKDFPETNLLAGTILGDDPAANRTNVRPVRLNEAELVRERKEGGLLGNPPPETPDKPVVRDPVLARALDLLKGLAVVRHSHD